MLVGAALGVVALLAYAGIMWEVLWARGRDYDRVTWVLMCVLSALPFLYIDSVVVMFLIGAFRG